MNSAISIDLETLAARYNAAIISIGAAVINLDTGVLGETFYREIDFTSAMRAGQVSADTLLWWSQQSDKARRVFSKDNKHALASALDDLRSFVMKHKGATVWGNGSSFDITILEHAYDHGAVGLSEPWAYWNIRDMRTLVDVCGIDKKNMPIKGVAHNALDDAKYQAEVISFCWRKARGAMGLLNVSRAPTSKPTATTAAVKEDDDL